MDFIHGFIDYDRGNRRSIELVSRDTLSISINYASILSDDYIHIRGGVREVSDSASKPFTIQNCWR